MTFDIRKIVQGKRMLREHLARLPVAEKLAMLDTLRERALVLRAAAARSHAIMVEDRAEYKTESRVKKNPSA